MFLSHGYIRERGLFHFAQNPFGYVFISEIDPLSIGAFFKRCDRYNSSPRKLKSNAEQNSFRLPEPIYVGHTHFY